MVLRRPVELGGLLGAIRVRSESQARAQYSLILRLRYHSDERAPVCKEISSSAASWIFGELRISASLADVLSRNWDVAVAICHCGRIVAPTADSWLGTLEEIIAGGPVIGPILEAAIRMPPTCPSRVLGVSAYSGRDARFGRRNPVSSAS